MATDPRAPRYRPGPKSAFERAVRVPFLIPQEIAQRVLLEQLSYELEQLTHRKESMAATALYAMRLGMRAEDAGMELAGQHESRYIPGPKRQIAMQVPPFWRDKLFRRSRTLERRFKRKQKIGTVALYYVLLGIEAHGRTDIKIDPDPWSEDRALVSHRAGR